MAWKSHRSYRQLGEASPFGPVAVALCIVLVLVAPWLLLALGVAKALKWLVG